jgi:ABC-type nitrate/sulfonate/bicarbonate transport system ATPase subunit
MQSELALVSPNISIIPPAAHSGRQLRRNRIAVDSISKSFGSLQVISELSFNVRDGETVAIVGPSGCGKSTLLNLLAGFDKPDQGGVLVDGALRSGPNPRGIVISQHGSVFPWLTVRENLMFGLTQGTSREKAELADHYIEMVGLKGFERAYPRELSGGMLKRVEIARAFVMKPEVLFMDEPFSALDALMSLRMRRELLRILDEERHTLVLITHDVEEAIHLGDRVLVLTERPTRIKASFDVPYAHPRKLSSPEAQKLKDAILSELGV